MTHASSLISGLRSVALTVPDLPLAEQFFTQIWHLDVIARSGDALYLRGTGADHHLLSLHQADGPTRIRNVTLRARSLEALAVLARNAAHAGGKVLSQPGLVEEPGGGTAVTLADPDGRIFQIVFGDERIDAALPNAHADMQDRPIRLAHAVLNAHDVEATRGFMEQVFDFSLADRTKIMAFMRCNDDHHSIAFGDTDNDALNHIAFLMPNLESVMRGGGRMKHAGYEIEWGPGRHGPGNNAFNYFIGPFGVVIEYTADVQQVDDTYQAGQPADWTWPPGRVDQWGISAGPSALLKQAQKAILFVS